MTDKHTKGSWWLDSEDHEQIGYDIATVYGTPARKDNNFGGNDIEWDVIRACPSNEMPTASIQRANAHLIASAPDLLEALKDIVVCEERRRKDLKNASRSPAYEFCDARLKKAQAAIAKAEGE